MFGSVMLEVAIGLIFVYLILSLICMTVNEWIAALWKMRSKTLEHGIYSMLNCNNLVQEVYAHPVIQGLIRTGPPPMLVKLLENNKPSYISSKNLAAATIDILQKKADRTEINDAYRSVCEGVKCLPEGPLKQAVQSLIGQAEQNIDSFRCGLEKWFDDSMERVTGWYKREIQVIGLIIALATSCFTNADTLQIIDQLYHDNTMRLSIVTAASEVSNLSAVQNIPQSNIYLAVQPHLPIGWHDTNSMPLKAGDWARKIIGLFLTAGAVSLGAPFWFDLLQKVMNVRFTGKKPLPTDCSITGKI